MKIVISMLIGLSINLVMGQASKTIYCNGNENVALILDQPILQAVTGSENFVFSYNQTASDSLGLLQGREGAASNLLIRTIDGGLYSFKISYRDSLPAFVHFITSDSRINPVEINSGPEIPEKRILIDKDSGGKPGHFRKLSNYYLARQPRHVTTTKKYGITVGIQGMYHFKNAVYLVVSIRNRSDINFSIANLGLSKVHGMDKRKSSYQKLGIEEYNPEDIPAIIQSGLEKRFVLVYPKFTLGDHESLELVVSEKNGSRYLKLRWD